MKTFFSKLIHIMSWLFIVVTVIASLFWMTIVLHQDGIYAMGFMFVVSTYVGGGSLLFGVFPSATLYFRYRQRRDLISIALSAISFLVIACETAILQVVPLHGC